MGDNMQNVQSWWQVDVPRLVLLCVLLCSCATAKTNVDSSTPDFQAIDKPYLYEVVRHLYRWYMDERDVSPGPQNSDH